MLKARRFFAYTIDKMAITAAVIGLGNVFPSTELNIVLISYLISSLLLFVVYFVLIPFFKEGRTVGKMIFRLQVDSISGIGYITLNQLFKRELLKSFIAPIAIIIGALIPILSNQSISGSTFTAVIYGFGDIMVWVIGWGVLLNPAGIGIHDRFANTIVKEYK